MDGNTLTSSTINGVTTSYTYPNYGYPSNWTGNRALTWKNGTDLGSIGDTSFYYDGEDQRIIKYTGSSGILYIYEGDQLVLQTTGDTVLNFLYDTTGLIGFEHIESSTIQGIYYYQIDGKGEIIGITDTAGNILVKYTYDAWGAPTSITDANGNTITDSTHIGIINPFRYKSYYYDTETGLYYLNSRYYDPQVCRFISADDLSLIATTPEDVIDKNPFNYCDNNPVIRADDGGQLWHIVTGAIVGGIIGCVNKAVSNRLDGEPINKGLITATFAGAASGAFAASTAGIGTIILANTGISMAENAINQVSDIKCIGDFNYTDMIVDGIIGGMSGALGGPGKGTKHLYNLGVKTITRPFEALKHKGLKAGLKEAVKAFTYYSKNTKSYYKEFRKGALNDLISAITTTVVSSNTMKSQYRKFLRGAR